MKSIIKILIGIMMLVTVAVGYIPIPEYLVEFTCMSNTLGGILLIIDGILNFKNKSVPGILYLNVCTGILFVFLICLGSLSGFYHMNYKGAFFFLHAVNPVLLILCYLITKKDEAENLWKHLAGAPVLLLLYLLFDCIFGKCRGYFVYGFFTPDQLTFGTALIIGFSMYVLLWLFGLGLFKLNRGIHKSKLDVAKCDIKLYSDDFEEFVKNNRVINSCQKAGVEISLEGSTPLSQNPERKHRSGYL